MKKKIETSKIFLFIVTFLTIFVVGFSTYQMVKLETTEPLCYLVPAIFTELGAATCSYYFKAKSENKVKIILSAIEEINKDDTITDEQTRIAEALINNLN